MMRISFLVLPVVFVIVSQTTSQQPNGGHPLSREDLARQEKQAGNDPDQLLKLVDLVDAKEGRRLLGKVIQVLLKNPQPLPETQPWRNRFVTWLPRLAANKEEVLEILASATPRQISRQIIYRRYLEQWSFDLPFRLIVVFDGIKGKDLRVQSVLLADHGP